MTGKKACRWAAVASCLMIPAVVLVGMGLAAWIDPEWAVHTSNYAQNFRLLQIAKSACMLATAGASGLLWLAVFFFLLRSKERSWAWLALALLGPLGLVVFGMLDDKAPASDDAHQRFLQSRGLLARAAYEALFFVAASFVSYQAVVLLRGVRVLAQAAATGMSVAQVAAVQNASGGMWAFSEGLEELFLLCLIYLAWPVVFNLAARLRPRAASQR